jgi:sugar diacid utilization regulator
MQQLDFSKVKGYNKLSPTAKLILERTYQLHQQAMGAETRAKFTIADIQQVKWDNKERTVNIFFPDIWWHYTIDGKWY